MLFRTRSAFSKALFSSSSSSSSFGEGLLSVRGEDVSEDPNPTHPRFSLHYLTSSCGGTKRSPLDGATGAVATHPPSSGQKRPNPKTQH